MVKGHFESMSEDEKKFVDSMTGGTLFLLVFVCAMNGLFSFILGSMVEGTWLLLGTLQLMSFIPLCSLNLPSTYRLYSKRLSILNGEPTFLPNIFDAITEKISQESFNQYFFLMNFKTRNFTTNSGRKIELWIIYGVLGFCSFLIF